MGDMITLYDHQKDELNLMEYKPAWAWFHETGTGKTILACENIKYLYLRNKIKAAIICAPKSVVKPVWNKTLFEHYHNIGFYIFNWIGGLSESQELTFKESFSRKRDDFARLVILLINTEAFSHNKVVDYVEKLCLTLPTMWIIDESTNIKTPEAKRTKQIVKLSHLAQYKRILSGFPILKSPEDLYSQIQFLGPNLIPHRSFYAFKGAFCVTKQLDNRVHITLGPKNVDKLQQLIAPFSSRVLKKDCLDLPEKVHTVREIEMTHEQRTAYTQMKKQGYVQLKSTDKAVFASTLIVQLGKLHQIANGLLVAPPTYINNNKYSYLVHLIENELGDNQAIIWACYTEAINSISIALSYGKFTYGIVYGATSQSERNTTIEQFIAGNIQFLVANPATIMHGLTFVNAHYAIYFNNSFSLEHRIQSEERLHRIGQTNKVTYIDLVTTDTVESKVLQSLELKHSIGASSIGDEWESWFQ